MGGKSGQTIGYHYIMTLLLGDCRGPVNEYLAIEGDDKIAWQGNASNAVPQRINSPDLFGGEKQEGGIQGAFIVLQGDRTQVLPGATDVAGIGFTGPCRSVTIPNIKTAIGGRVSEMRGFVSILYRGLVSSMNPYPKEWHLFRWRTTAGWYNNDCWYPAKATICINSDKGQPIKAMNPAHIIYQTLTDPEWGANRQPSEIDENSFILAANTLCSEAFGLCINWTRQEDVETFLQSVLDHVSGALYTDRTTGKIVFKLIRNDYVVSDLPLYDFNSGLLEITEDDSGSADEIINEIIVKGKDQSLDGRGKDFEVRVHNNSARQAQGAISDTLELPGLPTRELGVRRGQMELAVHAPGLKRFKLKFDRRAWQLTPAAVIRISSPQNNISNMVVRLGDDIDYGNTTDGTITASAIEDVFGMPTVSFQATGGSSWTAPDTTALPAAATKLIEAGYRDLVRRIGTSNAEAVDPTTAYIGQLAKSPSHAYQYELLSKTSTEGDYIDQATGSFTSEAVLSANATELATTLTCSSLGGITADNVGEAVMCGNEVMRLDAVDETAGTLTVARGCADTIPAAHASGTGVWLLDDDLVPDGREYVSGEIVQTKVLTRTTTELLDPGSATPDSVTVTARHYKPYPPGNVKVDGTSIYGLTGSHATPVLTWTHRDRLGEDDTLIEHGASSTGPEAGTTYNVYVRPAGGGTALRTVTALTGTTWTYDGTMQTADGHPTEVLMELEAERDTMKSWQKYSFTVTLGAAPPPPSPLVSVGFKDGAYSIGGVTKTLDDVVEHNVNVGAYSDTDVVAGVGLRKNTTGTTSPALTAAAFSAVTAAGIGAGFTVILTLALTPASGALAQALVSYAPTDESSAWEGFATSTTGGNDVQVYDYGSQDQDQSPATLMKVGFTFTSTALKTCTDGGTVATTGTPQSNAAAMIYLQAHSGGSGAVAVIEKAEFFAAVDDTTLQTLTS